MSRRRLFLPKTFVYQGLSALLIFAVLAVGCFPKNGVVGPGKEGVASLEKAQNLFNEAGGLDRPAIEVPAASLQKNQQVVNIIEQEVLGKVNKPLEVKAYALLAFSQWRLGNYDKAMDAGNRGRQLYETQNLTTPPREYGMCLIVGGLCLTSQTYKEFENLQGPPSKELRRSLAARLEQARQSIDAINSRLDPRDDIVIYANQWQLAIIDAAVRIWTSEGLTREVWQPEVCRWLSLAGQVFAKFPASPYPQENTTRIYKNKFERRQKEYCQGQ
jgi:hypothetical protein